MEAARAWNDGMRAVSEQDLAKDEQALGARFPDTYRAWAKAPREHPLALARVTLHPPSGCHWLDDEEGALVIGTTGEANPLVLRAKASRGKGARTFRDGVFQWLEESGRLARVLERVEDLFQKPISRRLRDDRAAHDARSRIAALLLGEWRTCPDCGREGADGTCACGRDRASSDPRVPLSAEEEAAARRAYPSIFAARELERALPDAERWRARSYLVASALHLERAKDAASCRDALLACWQLRDLDEATAQPLDDAIAAAFDEIHRRK
jgi:hypothetical protein